ncbi:unnamed protein product [Parajaminaea phylloscopi]
MQLSLFLWTFLASVATRVTAEGILKAAQDLSGQPFAVSLHDRNFPNNLEDAYMMALNVRLKQLRAIDNFKTNTGHYPPDTNLTAVDAIRAQLAPGGRMHEVRQMVARMSKRAMRTAMIDLSPQDNATFWSGPQRYGSPLQGPFAMDHDTGSSDTIINEDSGYKPSASHDAKETGMMFNIMYGDGTMASGPVYTDDFEIGGAKASNVSIGVAKGSTLNGLSPGAVGISGMAFRSISTFNEDSFFTSLVKQHSVPKDVFAFGLQRKGGRLDLGGIDNSAHSGKLTYVDVDNSNGFWQVQGSIDRHHLSKAIIDTGTTAIVLPLTTFIPVCREIGGEVMSNGALMALCSVKGKVPDKLTLTFGGASYKVAPETLLLEADGDTKYLGIFGEAEMVLNIGAIIGDTLLRNVYAVFEGSTGSSPRIGFAPTTGTP